MRTDRLSRLLGWLLALLLALSLSACGGPAAPAEPTPERPDVDSSASAPSTSETEAAPERLRGAVEVTGLSVRPNESVFGVCRDGDGAAVLLICWDEEASLWRDRLARLDPKTASVSEIVELESSDDLPGFSLLELTEEEIRLVDEESERCAAFDRSGRFLGLRDHPVMSRENLGRQNRLLSDDCFSKGREWAEFTRGDSGRLNRVVAFYDETDRVHILDEQLGMLTAIRGHRLLCSQVEDAGAQELTLVDLDAGLCLDRLRIPPSSDEEWVNMNGAVLSEDWALLSVSRDRHEQTEHSFLFWYPEKGNQTPADAEVLTEQFLTDSIERLRTELERAGMTLRLDEAPASDRTPTTGLAVFESTCETGASLFGQYWILRQLDEFVQKLPEGMIRELTTDLPGGEPSDLGSLHIYIVRNIPGDAAGFASSWTEPVLICFATEEFGRSHLAHEFMHIIDLRLNRYLDSKRRDLENEWWAMSPSFAYDTELSPEQSEAVDPYFVSWYARTGSNEDRAETFQCLFDSEEPAAEQWWYAGHEGVHAKAAWLIKMIRAAFPSVQATEHAFWEKLPDEG